MTVYAQEYDYGPGISDDVARLLVVRRVLFVIEQDRGIDWTPEDVRFWLSPWPLVDGGKTIKVEVLVP